MSRTNIDLDDDAVADVMATFQLATKRDAVNFALNEVRRRHRLTKSEALAMQGAGGWIGDLDELRSGMGPSSARR